MGIINHSFGEPGKAAQCHGFFDYRQRIAEQPGRINAQRE